MNDQPQYSLQIHRAAEKELASVPGDPGDELLERLRQLKYLESPTSAKYVKPLEDHTDLLSVKVEGYRALATLDKPIIYILLVDKRKSVYQRLDTAKERGRLE